MGDDIVYNKVAIIERCLQRINEEYEGEQTNLKNFDLCGYMNQLFTLMGVSLLYKLPIKNYDGTQNSILTEVF